MSRVGRANPLVAGRAPDVERGRPPFRPAGYGEVTAEVEELALVGRDLSQTHDAVRHATAPNIAFERFTPRGASEPPTNLLSF